MMKKQVAIFGAGVAGLAAAHEIIEQGFDVTVYEKDSIAGGFCKSARMSEDKGMPSEYSYRGFGPWYHNVFALMRRIPQKGTSVYIEELSRPVFFASTPDSIGRKTSVCAQQIAPSFIDKKQEVSQYYLSNSLKPSTRDKLVLGSVLLRTWCANKRIPEYAKTNATTFLSNRLGADVLKKVISTFGPWIGIDPQRTSLHHAGMFFFKCMFSGTPLPYHPADPEGGEWQHESNDGWLLLKRPVNEAWFDPWVVYLRRIGVKFVFNTQLTKINVSSKVVTSCEVSGKDNTYLVQADHYIMAIPPFAMRDIIDRSGLHPRNWDGDTQYSVLKGPSHCYGGGDPQLRLFDGLTADSPHIQVSFRIAFGERIHWSVKRTMIIVTDSEFNITLFPQDNTWSDDVYLGDDVKSLWSATACVSYMPGKLFGKPVVELTKKQFLEEVMEQMYRCEGLQSIISSANSGRRLESFSIVRKEVWYEWIFPSDSKKTLTSNNPKWVNSTTNRQYQPTVKTSIGNLFLAGAHVQTSADLWSMEAAAESGRAAASLIVGKELVLRQQVPVWIQTLRAIDDVLYSMGLPSVVDVFTASGTMYGNIFTTNIPARVPISAAETEIYTRVPISESETEIYTRVPISDSETEIYTRVPISDSEMGIYTRVPISAAETGIYTQISAIPKPRWEEIIMGQGGRYVDDLLVFEQKRALGTETRNINVAVMTVRTKYQFAIGYSTLVSLKIPCVHNEENKIHDYLAKLKGTVMVTEHLMADVPITRIYWQKTGNPYTILHQLAPLWKKL